MFMTGWIMILTGDVREHLSIKEGKYQCASS